MTTATTSRAVGLLTCVLALATLACGLTAGAVPPTATIVPPTAQAASATVASTDVPATTTPEPSPSAAPAALVRVSASGGNMTLRRGPATAYDVRGYFLAGQSTAAVARNQAADWLLVQDPSGTSGSTAWVNASSRYIVIDAEAGAVQALPVQAVDPAVPAYIRNCTYHPMLIQPVGVLLKEQFDAPNNMQVFTPGVYEAYDQVQEGQPKVKTEELREGKTIDIVTDGLGNTYPCPS
jgi:SH3-like domain-containing protein